MDFVLLDRKSTRLNSSHQIISYAVFCLQKQENNPLGGFPALRYANQHASPSRVARVSILARPVCACLIAEAQRVQLLFFIFFKTTGTHPVSLLPPLPLSPV